ncbi:aminoglycoside adenylyltransferase domain-containing protein [Streptomyces sp. NPDC088789]|uniref:aminoglycoside adenylyltransferase domain-containing protein n=1 Tax=Streptomyces sp. NPDC088789 TaxID=3365899 RepID=UPI0037F45F37
MSKTFALPAEVSALTHKYLEAVDSALPGFVELLYVTGSAALGAWQPPHSDIDTVIVTSREITTKDFAVLARIHEGMPKSPKLDGVYLDRRAFDARVADRRAVPFVVDGQFRTDKPCGELTPILWLLLRRYGQAVRGPAVDALGLVDDPEAVRRYNLENLRSFWQPLAEDVRTHVRELAEDAPADPEMMAWMMLGPARLHYTLETGSIVSKAGAATYVCERFPEWAGLAQKAASWREGATVAFVSADAIAAAASIDVIAENAWKNYGA